MTDYGGFASNASHIFVMVHAPDLRPKIPVVAAAAVECRVKIILCRGFIPGNLATRWDFWDDSAL